MKTKIDWMEGMAFNAKAGSHHWIMDAKAPIGKDRGPTPKELLSNAVAGCTAIDVVAWLKKHKQTLESFSIEVDTTPSDPKIYPVVFESLHLRFLATGPLDGAILLEAVQKSQSLYCGVSAMIAPKVPITYQVILNGEAIGEGRAAFA